MTRHAASVLAVAPVSGRCVGACRVRGAVAPTFRGAADAQHDVDRAAGLGRLDSACNAARTHGTAPAFPARCCLHAVMHCQMPCPSSAPFDSACGPRLQTRTGHVAVAEQADARAGLAALPDELCVARPVQDAHRHVPARHRMTCDTDVASPARVCMHPHVGQCEPNPAAVPAFLKRQKGSVQAKR